MLTTPAPAVASPHAGDPVPASDRSEPTAPRRAGRPTTRLLTREGITTAALRILTNEGFEAFTMTRLAAALKVTPAAIYNHAASKREILLWVQDRVMERIDTTRFADGDWATALVSWAVSYRDVMSRYAPLIAPIAVMPITGAPATTRMYETVAEALARGGWPSRSIVPVIVALESFIYGSAYDLGAPKNIFDTGDAADVTPEFTAAVRAHYSAYHGNEVPNVAFEVGLESLVAGLARRAGVPLPAGAEPTRSGELADASVFGVPLSAAGT